jgi:Domain of unknown function (DUF4442)
MQKLLLICNKNYFLKNTAHKMVKDFKHFDNFTLKITNPFYLWFFMITKLPSAFFSGVRLVFLDENECSVSVPYWWFSKNPFKSIYFACLAMAAEMSSGVLAMGHTYKLSPPVSMLVSKIEGDFLKKATSKVIFTTEDGDRIREAIRNASASGKRTYINAYVYGRDKNGDMVASFVITWAFKPKIS